ncbi:MAG: permease prefix domain 1-containing protein [Prolixibacteraceae bacterium]
MNNKTTFNLENEVDAWADKLKTKPNLTESDVEEMKSHLYDSVDALRDKGLNEKEAFVLARFRLGDSHELDEAYKEANQPVIQMRRSLLILAGVLVYFMAYYFILSTSKLLAIVLLKTGTGGIESIEWVSRYLITWHFIVALFFAGLFFFEQKTILFLENAKLKPKLALLFLGLTAFLAAADTVLFPEVKRNLGPSIPLKDILYHHYINFEFSFPLLIGICFVVIYYRYYKKTKPV